jgi:LacI family transcriptional regulator
MTPLRKVALVSPVWTVWHQRLLSGALRYADAHPRFVLRTFAPFDDAAAAGRAVQAWGAQGILGPLERGDLEHLLAALERRLPLVNCSLTKEAPGVVNLVGDFSAFARLGVQHLHELGLRSLALLVLEDVPQVHERLLQPFRHAARALRLAPASLVVNADRALLWNSDAAVVPVPARLAEWLATLPKPVGILCPQYGGGGYLIRCCHALKLRVPEDVAVVGSDDTDLCLAAEPTLTSILLSTETVGFEALRVLADLMAGNAPRSSTIRISSAALHIRESTGRRRPEICDIAGALECIRSQACRGITVSEVIRRTQRVSRVTFHRRFQEVVGQSPAEAIRARKLEEARRLLASTELPLEMVSELCGFSSARVLARVFRAVEGVNPREYRRRRQQGAVGQRLRPE